jgi:hypothetical protein
MLPSLAKFREIYLGVDEKELVDMVEQPYRISSFNQE